MSRRLAAALASAGSPRRRHHDAHARCIVLLRPRGRRLAAQEQTPVDRTEARPRPRSGAFRSSSAGRFKPLRLLRARGRHRGDGRREAEARRCRTAARRSASIRCSSTSSGCSIPRGAEDPADRRAARRARGSCSRRTATKKDTTFTYDELAVERRVRRGGRRRRARRPRTEWNDSEREIMMLRKRASRVRRQRRASAEDWEAFHAELRGGPPMIPPREGRVPGVEYSWGVLREPLGLRTSRAKRAEAVAAAWTRAADGLDRAPTRRRSPRRPSRSATAIAALGAPEYPGARAHRPRGPLQPRQPVPDGGVVLRADGVPRDHLGRLEEALVRLRGRGARARRGSATTSSDRSSARRSPSRR